MRLQSHPRALTVPLIAILIASCVDTDRVSGPTVPSAKSSKQGPTNSRILVSSSGSLRSMDDDGTRVIYLRFDDAATASWAPDGKGIVFSSSHGTVNGLYALYSMNEDGTSVNQLTSPTGDESDIYGRTVGKLIVFQREKLFEFTSTIWVFNPSTGGETQLTFGPHDAHPTGAPSGKLFAFERSGDIYTYEMATGAITNLTNTPAFSEMHPSWSPGGKQIAFSRVSNDINAFGDIYVMDADGSNVTQLTFTDVNWELYVFWSPDAKRLTFARFGTYGGDTHDVWVMNADGTNQINITPNTSATDDKPEAWAR
jgi:Tol biopolymer transport system component